MAPHAVHQRAKKILLDALPASVAGRLRSWRVRRQVASYRPRVVTHSYGGRPFEVDLSDPLAEAWYDRDAPEPPEVALLRRRRLRPGSTVFDLGAHQCVMAMMLARHVQPNGRVIAVEPNPHNVAAALRNKALNAMECLSVVQAAVSDQDGTVAFNEALSGQIDDGTGSKGIRVVDAVTIDALAGIHDPPDLLYLDLEGAECLALSGARGVLGRRPDVFVEVHAGCGLEKLGGSIGLLLSFFPRDRWEVLARAEDDTEFRPLLPDDPLTRSRFFMLALPRADLEPGAPDRASGATLRRPAAAS